MNEVEEVKVGHWWSVKRSKKKWRVCLTEDLKTLGIE